jgi:hypothetical protein
MPAFSTLMTQRLHNLGDDAANAAARQPDRAGGTFRQIQDTAADERAAIIDGDHNAAATVGNPQLGPERQTAMGGGHGVLVEALAGRGSAAGFTAVIGGYAGERPARMPERRISVQPRRPRGLLDRSMMTPVMMVVVVMPMMMVTRTGRCLGHAPRKENGCSDHGDRHARPG